MKIIFCDNTLWGLVNFRGEVIRHFVQHKHEVVLIAPAKEDEQMRAPIPEGVRFYPVSMGRTSFNILKDIKYCAQLLKIFMKEKPDYVFNYTIKPNIYGSIAARLAHVRSTAMMAGLGYIFIHNSLATRLARMLYRFGLHFTDHLLLLNSYNKELVLKNKMCAKDKIILLKGGEGVNIQQFAFMDNDADTITFLFIGRVLWDKGYDEFAQAARIVKQKYPDVKFEILGALDPSYPKSVSTERVKDDEEAGILKYIGFTSDMGEVYRRKGIVITLPSYSEGMNRTLMEACATGKPIITSIIPGCRESVDQGKNGFLVAPKDAQALATAMLDYLSLSKDEKVAFSKWSRKKAEAIFDIKDVISVYDEILN